MGRQRLWLGVTSFWVSIALIEGFIIPDVFDLKTFVDWEHAWLLAGVSYVLLRLEGGA